MRRGTQGHVAAPRGPAQRAYVARLYILYIYNIKEVFVLPYMGRVIPLETVGYYKPDGLI